jgi:uncharacterized protein YceK
MLFLIIKWLGGIAHMKHIIYLLLICTLISSTGCMTLTTLDAAKEKTHKDKEGAVVVDQKSQPGYYALVPVAVIGDIATSPFQLFVYLMFLANPMRC